MSTRLNDFRQGVVDTITTAMPALGSCESQLGRFDLDELERTSISMPAVRFGILRADIDPRADDKSSAVMSCAAFVIAEGKDRDDAAWTMAEAIVVLLRRNQRHGLNDIGAPSDIRTSPVLSAPIKRRGVAIIAVEWKQTLNELGAGIFDDDDIVWEELYVNDVLVISEPAT